MQFNRFQNTVLYVAGLTAMLIGAFIALDPTVFYAGYGIALEGNADMLSELRAPGVNLAVLGGVMLAGVVIASMRSLAIAASFIVFTSFAAGRVLSIVVDGLPSDEVLVALLVELAIAALCIGAFAGDRGKRCEEQPE